MPNKNHKKLWIALIIIIILVAVSIGINITKIFKPSLNATKGAAVPETLAQTYADRGVDFCDRLKGDDMYFCFYSYYFSEALSDENFDCSSEEYWSMFYGKNGLFMPGEETPIYDGFLSAPALKIVCNGLTKRDTSVCNSFETPDEVEFCNNIFNLDYTKALAGSTQEDIKILVNAVANKKPSLCSRLNPEGILYVANSTQNITTKDFYQALCINLAMS